MEVQVGGGQVLVGGGPQVAGEGLQGVVPDWTGLRVLTSVVALTQGGDAAAGTARQGGVTAPQGRLRAGGRPWDRVEGRLGEETVMSEVTITTSWGSTAPPPPNKQV